MPQSVEVRIDVGGTLGRNGVAQLAATVVLPDPASLPQPPVVCFAKPGGGYSRGYFTADLPGPASGAQAQFHADRGWIFVAMDNLGSADSVVEGPEPDLTEVVAAAAAAEAEVLLRLANGLIAPGFPPVHQPVVLGIGQSTGAMLTIVQQARFGRCHGIGVLGFSAVHSAPPTPPGEAPVVNAWFARDLPADAPGGVVNAPALAAAAAAGGQDRAWASLTWGFHFDDVPADVVEQDMAHYERIVRGEETDGAEIRQPWNSYTTPDAARFVLTPGVVATEAAAVTVPVLSAMGVRDLVPDPRGECRAFRSAPSFDLFICPRLGHMHNFGGTRTLFWDRIHRFGQWVAAFRDAG